MSFKVEILNWFLCDPLTDSIKICGELQTKIEKLGQIYDVKWKIVK